MKKKDNYIFSYTEKEKEYEELLLKREQLYREANSIRISYLKEFGEITAEIFKSEMESIRLKKQIAAYQTAINRGESIDVERINASIDEEMTGYYLELKDMLEDTSHAKNCRTTDPYRIEMAKKIYRRLAKLMHPDINKKTESVSELSELWNQIMDAYYANDPDRLEELEVMLNRIMKDLGEKGFEINHENIDEKIANLNRQLMEIVTSKPYIYEEMLSNSAKKNNTKRKFEKELEELKIYILNLEETLGDLLMEGGITLSWQMKF